MIAKLFLAGLCLLTAPCFAAPLPFQARIDAKRADDNVEITAIITNNSHKSACFLIANQGSFLIRYRSGPTQIGVETSEPSFRDGVPPPTPIQHVPADGRTYRYHWLTFPLDRKRYDSDQMATVETTIRLYTCEPFFSERDPLRAVFELTMSAPVE